MNVLASYPIAGMALFPGNNPLMDYDIKLSPPGNTMMALLVDARREMEMTTVPNLTLL